MIKISLKDLVVYGLILLLFIFGIVSYLNLRSQIGAMELKEVVRIHDKNFQVIDDSLQNISKAIQELKLQRQIEANVVGSGSLKQEDKK